MNSSLPCPDVVCGFHYVTAGWELLANSTATSIKDALAATTASTHADLVRTDAAGAAKPCDIYAAAGTPCAAAHSMTRSMYAGYSGRMYQLRRSLNNDTLDIHALISGFADVVRVLNRTKPC
jgi:hypothetical protein